MLLQLKLISSRSSFPAAARQQRDEVVVEQLLDQIEAVDDLADMGDTALAQCIEHGDVELHDAIGVALVQEGADASWTRLRAAVEPGRPLAVNDADPASGGHIMKTLLAAFTVAALALAASAPADAKGCIKGAVVGGVAGHYAGHHGVLGAAAGCLYGRHRANEQQKPQQTQGQPRDAQGKM